MRHSASMSITKNTAPIDIVPPGVFIKMRSALQCNWWYKIIKGAASSILGNQLHKYQNNIMVYNARDKW